MTESQDRPAATGTGAYRHLPVQVSLADTSTTHDTSAVDSYGSLGSVSATSPQNVALGPDGADGDGD